MKKAWFGFIPLVLVLASCISSMPAQQPGESNSHLEPTATWSNSGQAQDAAIKALSETIDLSSDQIIVVSSEPVTWPDDCLDVQQADVICTQEVVDGFRIILSANGKHYEYHTSADGKVVVRAHEGGDPDSIEKELVSRLASNLGIQENNISVIRNNDVQFADSCMEVPMPRVKCAQIPVPGQIILLEADHVKYEYHVRDQGLIVQPATVSFVWTRNGGVSGYCDTMIVFLSGEVYGSRCNAEPDRAEGTLSTLLSSDESDEFLFWMQEFGQLNLDASDPEGSADPAEVQLILSGNGTGIPSKSGEQQILTWIQNLFVRLYP